MTTTESRVAPITDPAVIADLVAVSQGRTGREFAEELYRELPDEMSLEEIAELGLGVNSTVELRTPSWDGTRKGNKEEVRVLGWLGVTAIFNGDMVTVDSVIGHLKTRGLKGRKEAWILIAERAINGLKAEV